MENIYYIFGAGLLVALISFVGVLIIRSHEKLASFVNKHLAIFTAVSAGIFLVTSRLLIIETLEILPVKNALVAFGAGGLLYFVLHKFLAPHRHQGDDHRHDHDNKKSAWKILIGDSLHNIADGLLLVASFGTSVTIGMTNAISIALHEVPQEISEFLVLKKSGYTNTEAVYRNFASGMSIFIGIVIGLFLIQTEILQAYLLGITSTFFLGIVFTDLFPVRRLLKRKLFIKMSIALILGVIIMNTISAQLDHGHIEPHDHAPGTPEIHAH